MSSENPYDRLCGHQSSQLGPCKDCEIEQLLGRIEIQRGVILNHADEERRLHAGLRRIAKYDHNVARMCRNVLAGRIATDDGPSDQPICRKCGKPYFSNCGHPQSEFE